MNSLHFFNAKQRFFRCSGFRHLVIVICGLLFSPVPVLAQGVYDRHVVILAIDGLQADIFERYAFKGEGNPPSTSILRQLSRPKGALKEHLNIKLTSAVFPTYTFAAWASIFTGKYPGRAGIQGQNFYIRDSDTTRAYDASAGVSDILLCEFPDAFEIFGWEFDCVALWGYLLSAGLNSEPFNLVGVGKLIEKLPEPSVWAVVPTPIGPIPWRFDLFDFYASGGIQNGDLLSRTLYDYAKDFDLKTYVIHNFYNRSNIDQTGKRVSWKAIYGSDLKGMDLSWGRPSYKENRDTVIAEPHDYSFLDKAVVAKAIKYVKNNNSLPHVLTLYFAMIDGESHHYVENHYASLDTAQLQNLRNVDLELIKLFGFLKTRPEFAKTIFLLIADHGHTAGKQSLSYHKIPKDKYRVLANGYMAHVYIKNSQSGNWKDPPTLQDVQQFISMLPQYLSMKEIETVIKRDPGTNQYHALQWKGSSWAPVPLEKLEDSPFEYMAPQVRIQGVNSPQRSGDVVLLPAKSIGHTQSTHGSLRESDSDVPFLIFGEPISKLLKGGKPLVFCEASHVDITPTILSLFNIYQPFRSILDGKPLLDHNLNINYKDFHGCRGSGASDFLLGRWKDFEGESTQTMLHNPSFVSRDAVLLYYGWHEDFLSCQIVRLNPHEMVILEAPLKGGGPLQIRAAPLQKEDRPGGLVGYIRSVSPPTTRSVTQLILEDQKSFTIKKQNSTAVRNCMCTMLRQKQSPLLKVFCP